MRNFIFFILFLFPIVASAQFPANPRKMRLGYQTTADGLIYRASGAPNFTPADSDDARVYIDTETGDLYVYNSGWIKTARKTDAITRVDTVNQINHGFSVGDPLWKSGDYVLARDTGLSVAVSGIVIDSFDANTFYVQRNGVFMLTGHGFTVDQQLYVQPDGSYSAADTVNSLVYGFAIDANTIQIGATTEGIRSISNYFDNSLAGRASTKQAMLDSLAGFQSFRNISAITAASPSTGYIVEDRSTGIRYRVTTDTISGLTVDNDYQRSLGGGKYIIVSNRHNFNFTDESIPDSITQSILSYTQHPTFSVALTDTATIDRAINLSAIPDNKVLTISATYSNDIGRYYLSSDLDNIKLPNSRYTDKLYLKNNQEVTLIPYGNDYVVTGYDIPSEVYVESYDDFGNNRFHRGQRIYFGKAEYLVGDNEKNLTVDTVLVKPVKDAAPWSRNLFTGYAFGSADSLSIKRIKNTSPHNDEVVRITSGTGNPVNDGTGENSVLISMLTPDAKYNVIGGKYTYSFWYRIGDSDANNSATFRIDVNQGRVQEPDITIQPDTINKGWKFYSITYTLKLASQSGTNIRPILYFDIDSNDTIYLADQLINEGPLKIDYRYADNPKGQLYATLVTDAHELVFEDLEFNGRYLTQAEELQAAIDLCDQIESCKVVRINEPITITKPIFLKENVAILGGDGSTKVVMYADINDPNSSVINFVESGGEGSVYNENQIVKGFQIRVLSPCRAVIDMRCGIDNYVENVSILGSGSFDEGKTWADSLHQYGIATGLTCGIQGLDNNIINCSVEDAWDYNFYLKNTKLIVLHNLRSMRANKSFYHDGVDAIFTSIWVEEMHNTGMVLKGDHYTIQGISFERVGEDQVSEPLDSNIYLIDMDGAQSFALSHTIVTGVDPGTVNAYFKIRNTQTSQFSNARVNQNLPFTPLFDADCTNDNLILTNWEYSEQLTNPDYVCQDILNVVAALNPESNQYFSKLNNVKIGSGLFANVTNGNGLQYNQSYVDTVGFDSKVTVKAYGQNRISYSEDQTIATTPWDDINDIRVTANNVAGPLAGMQATKLKYDATASGSTSRSGLRYISINNLLEEGKHYLFSFWLLPGNNTSIDTVAIHMETWTETQLVSYDASGGWVKIIAEVIPDSADAVLDRIEIDPFFFDSDFNNLDSLWVSGFQLQEIPPGFNNRNIDITPEYIPTTGTWILDPTNFTWELQDQWNINGRKVELDSIKANILLDSDGDTGTAGQIPQATASGWDWRSISYGEAYIDYIDPDSVTVVTAGNLYDLTDVLAGSSSSDVTISTTTGRLTYTGTTEKLFAVTWSATVTSDAVNENLIGTVMDNGSTITRIRWEEEGTASGDRHSVSASGFFSMGQNDWVQPKLTSQSNGTQIEVITMSFRIQEVR